MNERKRFQRIKLPRENEGTAAMAIDGEREERAQKEARGFQHGETGFLLDSPNQFLSQKDFLRGFASVSDV